MDHVGGVALVFLLSFSCANLTSVDIFPEDRVVVNKGAEFQIICKNLSPSNSWYTLQYVIQVNNIVIPIAYSWKDRTPCNKRITANNILGNMSFSCNYTVFVLTVFKASLEVNNVLVGCYIYVDDGDASTNYTTIKVNEPLNEPDVAPSGKQIITENLSTTFQCTARSYPAPDIFWYVNDRRLSTSTLLKNTNVSISTLTYKAYRNDNGQNLYCTASNEYESANSSMIMLEIRYLPNVTIIPDYTTYNVINGTESLIFGCSVTDANPAVTQYAWYKTGTSQPIVNQINLLFSGVTVFDNGNYFCQAENTVGLSISPEIQVNVLYGVKVNEIPKNRPLEGSKLMITCTADSNPQIMDSDIIWTKKDNTTFRDTGQLVIANVNREDSGVFICTVTLNLKPTTGMAIDVVGTTTVEVDVFYIPNIHMEPIYNPYIVYHNQRDVVLICVIDDPKPSKAVTYEWNSPSGTVNTQNLTIPTITKSHNGQYSCTATNIAGTSNKATKQIYVHYGPIILNISNQHDITEGNNLIVSPIFDSNPVSKLVWWTKQNNADFRYDGFVLRINNINIMSSGNYSCYVMNTLAPSGMSEINRSTHQTFFVNVLFKPFLDSTKPYSPRHVTATINSTLNLTITINANPLPTIEWTFRADNDWNSCNFVTIVSNTTSNEFFTTSSVLINNVNSNNFGDYVCTARNTAGIFSRRFIAMEAAFLKQHEMSTNTTKVTGMFLAGIVTLIAGLLSLMASVVFVVRNSLQNKTRNSSKTDEYSDVQRSNPAFTDAYTTLQSDIETRAPQEQIVNTYEECGRISEQHAYSSVDNMESEPSQPRQHRQHGVTTYEQCGKRIEAYAYDNLDK